MLKIRLARIGKKKQPYYRLTISEQARDTYGRALEILGSYNPRTKIANIKDERVKYWLSMGAQTSSTVHNLLVNSNIITEKKITTTHISAKRKAKKDGAKKEKTPTTKAKEDKKEEEKEESEKKPENISPTT